MATFELDGGMLNRTVRAAAERFERDAASRAAQAGDSSGFSDCGCGAGTGSLPPVKQESVISLKIYDNCRQQECLSGDDLGPSRSACDQLLCGIQYLEGEIIDPPDSAASVSIDGLRIRKVIIVDKRPNQFKRGFWDVDIRYVFDYCLVFREANGCELGAIRANSIYNKNVTLFGSMGSDIVIATDLLREMDDESPTLGLDPMVLVEAKPLALSAKLKYSRQRYCAAEVIDHVPNEVIVTIGLFTIIKLYRIVTLLIESRGFSIPRQCQEFSPINVCEYFDTLPFPMDVFAPPQKKEFEAGISGDIPNAVKDESAGCAG